MPKGFKVNAYPPPPVVHCDFCGRRFAPPLWNSRTCLACAVKGAPDQSKLDWPVYSRQLAGYQLSQGTERGVTRARVAANFKRGGAK